jgi:hypothetical protein
MEWLIPPEGGSGSGGTGETPSQFHTTFGKPLRLRAAKPLSAGTDVVRRFLNKLNNDWKSF